jgi:hypothetical protein
MKEIHFHGELCIREVNDVPKEASSKQSKGDFKLADSENTGNHHMLEVVPGVDIFQWDEEVYVKNQVDARVYCVLQERHDDLVLPGGKTWKITPAKEWDHIREERRNVLD